MGCTALLFVAAATALMLLYLKLLFGITVEDVDNIMKSHEFRFVVAILLCVVTFCAAFLGFIWRCEKVNEYYYKKEREDANFNLKNDQEKNDEENYMYNTL
jgi:uncharacterized membrane protein YidH (DUF202 family)